MVFSDCPSSIPVNSALSDFLSKTCTLSTASASKFLVTILRSPVKISLPFTKILFTFWPFTLTVPSLSTVTPGNFFNKSSTTALGWVLKFSVLKSIVSLLIVTGGLLAVTVTLFAFNKSLRATFPRSNCSAKVSLIGSHLGT